MRVTQRYQTVISVRFSRTINLESLSHLTYPAKEGRDLRLDLLRGFCVFAMIINHMGGESCLCWLTGGNRFFVSAAEGFVFISGLVLGMVSLQRIQRQGLAIALWAVLRRAWTLYVLSVLLALGFAVYISALGLPWGWDFTAANIPEIVIGTLSLHRTFYLIDILVLYTLLLLGAPVALLFLVHGRAKFLLLCSWLLWGAYQVYPSQISIPWPIQGGETFPLAAWQVLFITGLVLGYHREAVARKLTWLPRCWYLAILVGLSTMLVLMDRNGGQWLSTLAQEGNEWFLRGVAFEKAPLALGRLIAFAVMFQSAFLAITLFWQPCRAMFGSLLLPLGQNALYAYTMQIIIIGLFLSAQHSPLGYDPGKAAVNTWFQLGAVGIIWWSIRRQVLFGIIPR